MRFRICVLPALLLLLTTAQGADYIVLNNSDSGPGSLRQAILDANSGGGGTITFSNVTGVIDLISGLPILTTNITIAGPGASELALTNSNRGAIALLTNSMAITAAISGITICGTLENYGTLVMLDSLVGNQFNPGHAGLYNSGTTTLSRCVFTGNRDTGYADAIENDGTINIDHCSITNNKGGDGSIYNTGNLTMDNSIVAGHTFFTSSSGGIVNDGGFVVLRNCAISNNWSVQGGGVWNGGFLSVTNCLISSNRCEYSSPPCVGGGLYNIGYSILQNSTISGNRAQGEGGGIWNGGGLRLLNCTISSNTVSMNDFQQPGTGGGVWNSPVFQSKNSIIAGNYSFDSNRTLVANDISGYLESFGHNLILSTNGWLDAGYNITDLIGVDPMLGPLQDNGGPTSTHALLQGSPAIDAGDPAVAPADDQRGVPRPQASGVDIGAFEFQFPTIPVFTRVERQSQTNLFLKAFGVPSKSYILQASQDLISWENIGTVTSPPNGILQFTEPIDSYPKRFFRLQSHLP